MSISSSSTTTDPSIAGMGEIQPYTTAAKRRRTRRRRLRELHPPTPSCSSSTSSSPRDHEKITHDVEKMGDDDVEEEEEDNYMAYCLMLLSRGRAPSTETDAASAVATPAVVATDTHRPGEAETGVYRCKTCNKAFSSFQALGGHRTSHTKVKLPPSVPTGTAAATSSSANHNNNSSSAVADAVAVDVFPPKPRVHACSICGAEFASGQALGGHMRRHRPVTGTASATRDAFVETEGDKAVMLLDLNAPPPQQLGASGFTFAADDPPPLPFSALVDCHY